MSLDEAQRIIARIEDVVRDRHVVLVGGQAVSVWIGQLEDRLGNKLTTAPVVSRDIDFLGNTADLQRAGNLLGGRVHVAGWQRRTPLAGAAMFLDSDGHKRRLDFLESVYGMNSEDIRTTAIEIDLLPGEGRQVPVWVMHPERCMESRVHNSVLANKQTDLAWRQLEASVACARAFSRLLLDERGEAAIRDVLKLNERIFRFAQEDRCAKLATQRGIEAFDAVLDDERLPEKFTTVRLPQMQGRIQTLRQLQRERYPG